MTEYRALTVGALGNTIERRSYDAEGDAAAIERARAYLKDREIEVWCEDRKVALLTPKAP